MTGPIMHCGCGHTDCTACAGYGWACTHCGAAWFGTPPDDGLCPSCQAARGARDAYGYPVPCRRTNAHTAHGLCPGTAPEFPWEPVEQVTA
jgi:hypothetical protein